MWRWAGSGPPYEGGQAMKRDFTLHPAALVLSLGAVIALAVPGETQTRVTAGIRGKVADEKGAPIPDVKIDMEYEGESRQKIVKSQLTDKKGGFVRMGLAEGKWKFTFSKEGYKTYMMEMNLSLG